MTTFLMVMVGLPIAALMWEATSEGTQSFWDAVSSPEAVAALKLTLVASLAVSLQRSPRDDHGLGSSCGTTSVGSRS